MRELRYKHRWTYEQIAVHPDVNCSPTTVYNWLSGKYAKPKGRKGASA